MMQRITAFVAAVAISASAANAQNFLDIPIDQAGAVATQALVAGDTALAVRIAETVLTARPDDQTALLIVAAGAPQLGNPARGREAGARAWRLAQSPAQKYEAARLTALAANAEGKLTTASFWLRMALISAPSEAEATRTRNDARVVAQRNPLSMQLSFSVAPSSNVNGGAESEISSAPGNPDGMLTEDALALAGWRATLGVAANYRFQESNSSRSTIGLSLQATRVWLTEDTTIPGSAFDSEAVEVELRHERRLGDGLLGMTASTGTFSYRDFDLSSETTSTESYDQARLALDYRMGLAEGTALQLTAAREALTYASEAIGTVERNRLGAAVTHRLASGDTLSLSYSVTASVGDNDNYTADEQSLSIGYGWAEPFGPVTVSVGGGIRWAEYPDYRLLFPVTGGRQDETVFANINLGFPQAEIAGFIPGLRIDASRAESNVSRFTRDNLGVGLTVRSAF